MTNVNNVLHLRMCMCEHRIQRFKCSQMHCILLSYGVNTHTVYNRSVCMCVGWGVVGYTPCGCMPGLLEDVAHMVVNDLCPRWGLYHG